MAQSIMAAQADGSAPPHTPGSLAGKRPACDRCRGQKLRCIWEDDATECRRCARARAVCIAAVPRPMGRPSKMVQSYAGSNGQMVATHGANALPHMDAHLNADAMGIPGNAAETPSFQQAAHNFLLDPLIDGFLNGSSTMEIDFDEGQFLPSAPALSHSLDGLTETQTSGGSRSPYVSDSTSESPAKSSAPSVSVGNAPLEPIAIMDQLSKMSSALFEHLSRLNRSAPASGTSSPSSDGSSPPYLGIGRLLSITDEFKSLAYRLGLPLRGSSNSRHVGDPFPCDQATGLLLLSCFVRLRQAYDRTKTILDELEALLTDKLPGEMAEVLPDLVIDGFPLGGHPELQIKIAKQVCEGAFGVMGAIPLLEGHMDPTSILDWNSIGQCLEKIKDLK